MRNLWAPPTRAAKAAAFYGLTNSDTQDQTSLLEDALNDTPSGAVFQLPAYARIRSNRIDVPDKRIVIEGRGATLVQTENEPIVALHSAWDRVSASHALADVVPTGVNASNTFETSALTLASAPDPDVYRRGTWLRIGADLAFPVAYGESSSGALLGEVAQVLQVEGSVVYLAAPMEFAAHYPASIWVCPFPVDTSHSIQDLSLDSTHTGFTRELIRIYGAQGARLHNICTRQSRGTGVLLIGCMNTRIARLDVANADQDSPNGVYGYGINVASSYYTAINEFDAVNCRHGLTTTSGTLTASYADPDTDGMSWYGMTQHLSVVNTRGANCNSVLDTHELCSDVSFDNYDIRDCNASDGAPGISVRGYRVKVGRGTIQNCQRGVVIVSPLENGAGEGIEVDGLVTRNIHEIALNVSTAAARAASGEIIPLVKVRNSHLESNTLSPVLAVAAEVRLENTHVHYRGSGVVLGVVQARDNATVHIEGGSVTSDEATSVLFEAAVATATIRLEGGTRLVGNRASGGLGLVEFSELEVPIVSSRAAIASDYSKTIVSTFGGVTIPASYGTLGFPTGFWFRVRNEYTSAIVLTLETGVTIDYDDGTSASLSIAPGETITVRYVGPYSDATNRNVWRREGTA